MKTWATAVAKAEDEYLPSGPPMSPLTGSYFWMWAIYDLRIGKSTDTVAYCQIAMNDVIQMNAFNWRPPRIWKAPGWGSTSTSAWKGRTSSCGN